jgi:hypothetical protein
MRHNAPTGALSAVYSDKPNSAEIKTRVDAVAAAELAVASARAQAFAKLQASPAKLNAEQTQA